MSQVITDAFSSYWQQCLIDQTPVVLDEFVLAHIPGLDPGAPIDPASGLPPAEQVVHRHAVDQRGRINNDAVAYSIVMDTTVGDFTFNAMYLINSALNLVGMIVHKGEETKLRTDPAIGQTGNSLVKSMLMEYDRAAEASQTVIDASTWQIDYAARLRGMDEDMRRQAMGTFGHAAFYGDGFKLVNDAGRYLVQPGQGYVGGLLVELAGEQEVIPDAKPVGLWLDVHRAGSLLSPWINHIVLALSTTDLVDYVDASGYPHYVTKLATINGDESVTDTRARRTLTLSGDVSGQATFNGPDSIELEVNVEDNSHGHTIENVTELQEALDDKSPMGHTHTAEETGAVNKAGDTMTGPLVVNATTTDSVTINKDGDNGMLFSFKRDSLRAAALTLVQNSRDFAIEKYADDGMWYRTALRINMDDNYIGGPTTIDGPTTVTGNIVVNGALRVSKWGEHIILTDSDANPTSEWRMGINPNFSIHEVVAGTPTNRFRVNSDGSIFGSGSDRVYTTSFKPTSADVGAVPLDGSTPMTGPLTVHDPVVGWQVEVNAGDGIPRVDILTAAGEIRGRMDWQEAGGGRLFLRNFPANQNIMLDGHGLTASAGVYTEIEQPSDANSLTRKDYVDAQKAALKGDGQSVSAANVVVGPDKVMASVMLVWRGKWVPFTFPLPAGVTTQLWVPNYGGESADRDYSFGLEASYDGNTLYMVGIQGSLGGGVPGIGGVYAW